jgi:hypothetical protein
MRTEISGFVMLFALTGCAMFGVTPVKDSTDRIEAYGFSILPPPGKDWKRRPDVHIKGSDFVVLGKKGSSRTHTIGITVGRHEGFDPAAIGFAEYAKNPDVFAAYVKNSVQNSNPPEGRMRILELSVVPDTKRGYCAKEYAKFEDHGSPFKPKILIQEDSGYVCLHPDSSRVLIEMISSERGLPGESDPSLPDVREKFFDSFQFRPLR